MLFIFYLEVSYLINEVKISKENRKKKKEKKIEVRLYFYTKKKKNLIYCIFDITDMDIITQKIKK